MDTAAQHLSTFKPGLLPEQQRAVAPLNGQQIGHVFKRLQAQLGVKLADLYAGVKPEEVRDEWASALGGYDNSEIIRGLDACQTRVFAPNLGEFLHLCRPALDPEIAWLEACNGIAARALGVKGDWSHPAVYRAAMIFVYELKQRSFKECKKSWAYTLQREFGRGWGKGVPDAPVQLEHQPAKACKPSPEQAAKIAELLGRGATDAAA